MEDTAGWKVAIAVPQPNGGFDHHLWVAAIPDEEEVRARLWLWQIPCEAQLEPLSAYDLMQLGLEAREVRRIWGPAFKDPTSDAKITDDEEPEQKPEDQVVAPTDLKVVAATEPKGPDLTTNSGQQHEDPLSKADLPRTAPPQETPNAPSKQSRPSDRLWRRLTGEKANEH